mgnify:CR=1 FL=1|tara:strand:+ start:729 stop:1016 length:288 start_codon:yes stop_codon:yes gene_type:complete
MKSETNNSLKDPLSERFMHLSNWLVSNELHLEDYKELRAIIGLAVHRDLSIQITHACARRIHLVPDPLIDDAKEMGIEHVRECTQDGIKIVWVQK